jgi:integral membrane sensor domain MASE1
MSFALAFTYTSIAPVWLPSGLAVAAVVVFGPRLALGVLIGAFAFNAMTPVPLGVAGLIAVGNAAEALCAAMLLRRAGY